MDVFDRKTNEVDITVTAPSDNEMAGYSSDSDDDNSGDFEHEPEHKPDTSRPEDANSSTLENSKEDDATDGKESELCERFDSGVSLNEDKSAVETPESGGQNYEIVGDRVLVEKDGKFELVDANEIKAEYFEMLGIKHEASSSSSTEVAAEKSDDSERPVVRERPKTTPAFGSRGKDGQGEPHVRKKRVQSSWGYRNSEYAKIKSPYGLSEKQLEMKRKREEAIARRKKEEAERQKEEENRKREDAERAFQAWLNSKREEEKEHRRMAAKESNKEDESRAKDSQKAFKAWKSAKRKQENAEREAATRRMQETASMYVVHDRGTCEDAFKRWLKKKKNEKKAKEEEKIKRLRPKSRRKPKEPLPVNSDKIRFTDNYGYRNTVVY
ncbi:coiled-coil domain-containing protein 181-like [Dendronephthya gigantea]|uniref:coiled-coil domain-containing protein 181-like n=1 Tax=Dendronephthya gigantea TaxID=151771 RepID=UPI00106B35A9|nr:coiled-coil domain-containing protein 181-like [Dendronephthya gigantea]